MIPITIKGIEKLCVYDPHSLVVCLGENLKYIPILQKESISGYPFGRQLPRQDMINRQLGCILNAVPWNSVYFSASERTYKLKSKIHNDYGVKQRARFFS